MAGARGGQPSATGGSANNAHDAVATMEIIIKPSTCNDLWALSLVRAANNRSTAVRRETVSWTTAPRDLTLSRGTESIEVPPENLIVPFAAESYRETVGEIRWRFGHAEISETFKTVHRFLIKQLPVIKEDISGDGASLPGGTRNRNRE